MEAEPIGNGDMYNDVHANHGMQNGHTAHLMEVPPAHDWEDEKRRAKSFFDDGTMTFFW